MPDRDAGRQDWLPELAERAAKLQPNFGKVASADLGPVVSKAAKARIEKLIQSGVDQVLLFMIRANR